MKVAFACEDPANDRYIARSILEAALSELGKPHARVFAITNPRTRGFHDLVSQCCDILNRYAPQAAAVAFLIDVDCDDGRAGHINKPLGLRNAIAECRHVDKAVVVAAVQEVEV